MICHEIEYFECIISEQNKSAFYELIAGQDLFGYVVIRRWGRIGTKGQPRKRQRFFKEKEMLKEVERIHKKRLQHNYILIDKIPQACAPAADSHAQSKANKHIEQSLDERDICLEATSFWRIFLHSLKYFS